MMLYPSVRSEVLNRWLRIIAPGPVGVNLESFVFSSGLGEFQLITEVVADAELAVAPWLAFDALGEANAAFGELLVEFCQVGREDVNADGRSRPRSLLEKVNRHP